jgi:16S rRNA (cytidine1402-2'-O)-methyltransferase
VQASEWPRTIIFYEAPHRILQTLEDLEAVFGAGARIVAARELTKVHEELLRGTANEVRKELEERDRVRGEFTVLVEMQPRKGEAHAERAGAASVAERVRRMQREDGIDEKEALKRLARETGKAKSELYRELQRERSRRR